MRTTREKLKLKVLSLIANNDGKLTWFGIARTIVDAEFLPIIDELGEIFEECEQNNLVKMSENDRYKITENGEEYLQKNSPRRQREMV